MRDVTVSARDSSRSPVIRRVVFLLPILDVGGAERTILRSAVGFDRSRFAPTVVAMVKRSDRLADELDAAGIRTVVLDTGTRPRMRQLYRLFRWLRANPPDVLLSYMFHANLAARLMRRIGAAPAVVCSERSAWESRARILLNRVTVSWADAITVNSAASRRSWARDLGIPEGRISVVHNGIDTTAYAPGPPTSQPVIGVLARLHRHNGHDWFLDALADLDRRGSRPWTCVLAGTGPEEPALRARVADLGLRDRVRFLGHVDDPPAFLRSLMLCVHPARFSGMPNAVLEAMACRLPVIGTTVGGTPEAIEHGRTGWLVTPDDTTGTSGLLARLLEQSDLRLAVGARARERVVERFSIDAMVSGTEAVISELLDRRGAGR